MTKIRTIRAKNPDDLLAVVPRVLGFHPESSLVVLTIDSAGDPVNARVDLPYDGGDIPTVVSVLLDAVMRNGVRRVAVIAYSEDQCLSLEVSVRLLSALEEAGVSVPVAIRADGDHWYCLGDCADPCCPAEGTPYDVRSHALTAQAVLEGQVVLGSRRELADSIVGSDPEAIAAVQEAADQALARFQAASRHPLGLPAPKQVRAHVVGEGLWVRDRVCRYLQESRAFDDVEAGRILVAMMAIDVRDVAWAEMSRANAAQHVELWRDLLRRAPYDLMAAPAALLGFAAWLSGDGALAWCAVERCQEVEPDYRMAELLATALEGAVPPSAWRPVGREELDLFAS